MMPARHRVALALDEGDLLRVPGLAEFPETVGREAGASLPLEPMGTVEAQPKPDGELETDLIEVRNPEAALADVYLGQSEVAKERYGEPFRRGESLEAQASIGGGRGLHVCRFVWGEWCTPPPLPGFAPEPTPD